MKWREEETNIHRREVMDVGGRRSYVNGIK